MSPGGFFRRHPDGVIAAAIFVAVFAVLCFHAPQTGFTRDEGYYFDAAERYAGWFRELVRDPGGALTEPVIRRYYETNREHPVLVKNLMALSYLAFAPDPGAAGKPGSWTTSRALRLPQHLIAALGVALVYLFGCSLASRRVGAFAAAAFILAPRHFFHAQLACFDMPITVAWLAVVMAYRKGRTSLKWGIATGAMFGIALSVKHNAFFLPVVLLIHWIVSERRAFSFSRAGIAFPRIPIAFVSMAVLGPLLFVGLWPFLWHATVERIGWYFGFHLNHIHYPWEYFGHLLTEPPFPWLYPFVITALVTPLPTLLLGAWGLFGVLGERLGRPARVLARLVGRFSGLRTGSGQEPRPWLEPADGWLLILNALLPLLIIALPSVPIFGGMKHWMHGMPFLCLMGGLALDRILQVVPARLGKLALGPRRAWPVAAALAVLPSLLGTCAIGPYGTSFYAELAGGVSGAADLGMQRQYWSNNVTGVLPWINANLPQGARLYLHEVNGECFRAYQREGFLRRDIRMAWAPDQADYLAVQYHREFVDTEFTTWDRIGTRTILHGLYVDDVPLVLVYDLRRAEKEKTLSR